MSGHSKWSQIKRAKGVADQKRGATFTKLANAIALAARSSGVSNPDDSPRLRMAVDAARAVNMPKDNIQRAIDRGLGKLPGQSIEEVLYEGFGPGRVAFLIEVVTDNKNRSVAEIKNIFDRAGGVLGSSGSASFMFDRKGELKIESKGGSTEDEELELIDLGAEDIEVLEEGDIKSYLVYREILELNTMGTELTQADYKVESQEIIYKPIVLTEVTDPEVAKRVVELADKLEEHDDVQKVFANFEIPEDLI